MVGIQEFQCMEGMGEQELYDINLFIATRHNGFSGEASPIFSHAIVLMAFECRNICTA